MDPVEITAGRWHLRPWQPWDVAELVAMCSDPVSHRFTTVPAPYTEQHASDFVDRAVQGWADGSAATWAVCESTTGEPLGNLALRSRDLPGTWDVGFLTAPGARGQGLMPEALASACRWAFAQLDAQRVEWLAEVGNWASRRVAEKAGFTVEGVLRHGLDVRGRRVDCWVGARLPADPQTDTAAIPSYPEAPGMSDGVVRLRPWRPEDAADVQRACQDPDIQRWLPVPVPYSGETAQAYVTELVPRQWADGVAADVAIADATSAPLVASA